MVDCVEGFYQVNEDTPGVFVVFFPGLKNASESKGAVLAAYFGGTAKLVFGAPLE